MKRNHWKSVLAVLLLLPFTVGFRVFPGGNNWPISPTDPTLWIQVCRQLTFTKSGFPPDDPLYQTLPSFTTALQSIVDDYNNVGGSYVRLAVFPNDPNNPGTPAAGDSPFTSTRAAGRTIDVCFNSQTVTAGYSQPKWNNDGIMTSCSIELSEKLMDQAHVFVEVLTHELGHCLGLDHPQETTHSIMSYYANVNRLQIDDKMGIVNLYPKDPSYGREQATLGMSCAPAN